MTSINKMVSFHFLISNNDRNILNVLIHIIFVLNLNLYAASTPCENEFDECWLFLTTSSNTIKFIKHYPDSKPHREKCLRAGLEHEISD